MSIKNFVQVLKACESAEGEGTKKIIKEALGTATAETRTLFKYAMDPFLVFGVKKFEMPSFTGSVQYSSTDNLNFKLITNVLDKLAARELTGNAARTAVTSMLGEFTEDTAKYLARVIDKDLQAGFSPDTYNKVWKQDPVRVFDVMLADKCEEEEDFEEIEFPCIGDIKYDGERNVCFQLKTETNFAPAGSSYRSRSGKIAEHMYGLFDEELAKIREHVGYDFVLDGERMAKNYIETINAKKSGKDGDAGKKNMIFRVFFIMPLADWIAQSTPMTMEENREYLKKIIEELDLKKIVVTDAVEIMDYTHMRKRTAEVTTPGFDGMPKGQEGLILKRKGAKYRWDRSLDWCKVKNFYDADARIISWEYGKKSNSDKMGRVNVAGWLEDGTYFEVGVGSGWTKAQRIDFVTNFDTKWKGKTMVVWYQEVSKSKNKEHHSLRFPTVDQEKLLRDDKIVPLKDD